MTPTTSDDPTSPDRHRLDDLIRLAFDQAQTSGEGHGVTAEEIAGQGPYSAQQISDHLAAESDTYVVESGADGVRVVGFQGPLDD